MGVKLLLALLTVMLVILLVFNVFNIAYAPNDFMGTMLTVENGLGQVSDFALKAFEKVKEFVLSGADLLESFYNATFGKLITWLDENIVQRYNLGITGDMLSKIWNKFINTLSDISLYFDYFTKYGFNIFVSPNKEHFDVFVSCMQNSIFYDDYLSRDGFDWNKFEKYRDAYLYSVENEYSYLITRHLKEDYTDYVKFEPTNTVVFDNCTSPKSEIYYEKCDLWFTTVDLSIPDDYCAFLSDGERFARYFNDVIPVYDSNYTYTFHDYECTLTGFVINDYYVVKNSYGDSVTKFDIYGDLSYIFWLTDKYSYGLIDLVFTYIGPAGKSYDITVKFGDYIKTYSDNMSYLFLHPVVRVLDYNAT